MDWLDLERQAQQENNQSQQYAEDFFLLKQTALVMAPPALFA